VTLQAILFDLYDTLAWSDWPTHSAMLAGHLGVTQAEVISAYDHLRDERDSGVFADSAAVLRAVMEYCNLEADDERIQEFVDLEAGHLAEHVVLYEDTIPTLRRLRAVGYRTGVVSNCSPSTRPVVDRLRLEDETGVVVLSCEVGQFKPAPGIFESALRALDVSAEHSLFVDDRVDYLDGAAGLGMSTVRIVRQHAFGEDVEGGDHPVVSDLEELMALL
jgi:putative hydrolase of the HAD superfamily